jgi:hypothetical protein
VEGFEEVMTSCNEDVVVFVFVLMCELIISWRLRGLKVDEER